MNSRRLWSLILTGALAASPILGICDDEKQSPMHKFAQYVDDSAITAKVKATLVDDAGLNSFDINVKTYNGKVLLSGFVNTQEEADRAVEKTKAIEGVKGVNNSLVVKE